jgi:ferredoxin
MLPVNLSLMSATPTAVHPERCLWQRHQGAACKYCFEACQTGALKMAERSVLLDVNRCTGCGVCLAACPVECFESADWSERDLLGTAARLERPSLEVACKCHPAPEVGNQADFVIKVGTCLGAISPGLWFELGLEYTLRVRLEYCAACPLMKTSRYTLRAIELANGWLEARGLEGRLNIQVNPDDPAAALRRKVISAERPVLNRRDFLFGFARSSGSLDQALAGLPPEQPAEDADQKLPPHLPTWLRRLAVAYPAALAAPTPELPTLSEAADEVPAQTAAQAAPAQWPSLKVADNCVACGACARYCPSGALSTSMTQDGKYQHIFSPGICVACGLCAQVCSTGALTRTYEPCPEPFAEHVMAERTVSACRKCGSPSLIAHNGLCYWCATEAPMRSLLDNAGVHMLRK